MATKKQTSTGRNRNEKAQAPATKASAAAIGAIGLGAAAALVAYLFRKAGRTSYSVGRSNSGAGVKGSDAIAAVPAPANPGGPSSIEGDAPTDLRGDRHPGPDERAPIAFRPDPTAPVPEGRRDAFAPATMPTLNSAPAGM